MSFDQAKIRKLIEEIELIVNDLKQKSGSYRPLLDRVHPNYAESARNLVYYRTLRTHDLRELQKKLGNLGLSRFAKAESHVMASLQSNLKILNALLGENYDSDEHQDFSIREGSRLINQHADHLLGYLSPKRNVRIMVTLPSEAAYQPVLIENMIESGMNTVRINCAHDGPEEWLKMIGHVRELMKKTGRDLRIAMDLGGPKIRTGEIVSIPGVIRIKPERDIYGRVINPGKAFLVPHDRALPVSEQPIYIPVERQWMKKLKKGDSIGFTDTRGRIRKLRVVKADHDQVEVSAQKTAYIATGTIFTIKNQKDIGITGRLPVIHQTLLLKTGDKLVLHGRPEPGEPAITDSTGKILKPAHISCTSPEIFQDVEKGDLVLFDDGKIEGKVLQRNLEELVVKITHAQEQGSRLGPDKGINFPDSDLKISGLTSKDRQDLKFIAKYADVVNMSFVNRPQDVEELFAELNKLKTERKPGLILKIETKNGFRNLVEILLTAMQINPIGVMIARGDLAIECGWENIGRIQEEILWLCQAGHVPTVWATQVLENLAKKGIPSRAEITDAVMSQRADCVMLNKGPHILDAIKMLDSILKNMQYYQERKAPLLPPLDNMLTSKESIKTDPDPEKV